MVITVIDCIYHIYWIYMAHTRKKPFPCDECLKFFPQVAPLKMHKETILEINNLLWSLPKGGTLKLYVETHPLEKAFSCDQCHKSFYINKPIVELILERNKFLVISVSFFCSSCHFKDSQRNHTGERSFGDHCLKSFSKAGPFKMHRRTNTVKHHSIFICISSDFIDRLLNMHSYFLVTEIKYLK